MYVLLFVYVFFHVQLDKAQNSHFSHYVVHLLSILPQLEHCDKAYLEVRDGGNETATLIGIYCEDDLQDEILMSSSNMLWLKFVSTGSSETSSGFTANYTECN